MLKYFPSFIPRNSLSHTKCLLKQKQALTEMRNFSTVTLSKNTNQARGLAEYAIEFMRMDEKKIDDEVYKRT